jgi:hypothetical protein
MPPPSEWSVSDKKFLRSLRVVADEPAAPSLRFVVERGKNVGEFNVIDRQRRSRSTVCTPAAFADPRAAAEDIARQLNEKHHTGTGQR